ncbi:ATP-dependent DNA helicase RecG [Corynebacterium choanae]|uniref:ATP-dependent DNA helicase RecG n=1 Tax=Corynebacterium choanae TaxID=1862358 RepID=A0A3G6J6M8_9CORY|nr:ATP-dependent DNA helicase RecG [Corynebacterium choanae]AZA13413.1 ATP-dependent DNA helicase RecG [Corynebacterium choanae]
MLGWQDNTRLDALLPKKPARRLAAALGGDTVTDLLLHYPRAYSHHGSMVDIEQAQEGDTVTCIGQITHATRTTTARGQQLFTITVASDHNSMKATFFGAKYLPRQLPVGTRVMLCGKVKFWRGSAQLSHPAYVVIPDPGRKRVATGGLQQLTAYGDEDHIEQLLAGLEYVAIYPTKKGTTSWEVLGAVDAVLRQLAPIAEPLDEVPAGMLQFDAALRQIHQPVGDGPQAAIRRIKYNEALSLALVMALRRADAATDNAPAMFVDPASSDYVETLVASLPFALTQGQQQVIAQLRAALRCTTPMMRLLQGDVGSGKTLVALAAMLHAAAAGFQSVLLAPTEVLASQHAATIAEQLAAAGLRNEVAVTLLTGSLATKAKQQALLAAMTGQAQIIVATHAVLSDGVVFDNLGLVVVDEQHRFGVEQRDRLRQRRDDGRRPHLLVMTATPIPRTIAMTLFGDLDVSTLHELPAGRTPISTAVVPEQRPTWVARAWQRIDEEITKGHQAFVVCHSIDGENGVTATAELLQHTLYPHRRIGIVHGRLSAEEKAEVMAAVAAGTIDILVATTVIEVGIDIPNATVIYIRNAEHFGVSQLHQLRGRVGRGTAASLCLLHTTQPEDSPAMARLQAVASTVDGFTLAELDLQTRREGDIFGTAQSGGKRRVTLLDLVADTALITQAVTDANKLVARNPQLAEELIKDVADTEREFIEKT